MTTRFTFKTRYAAIALAATFGAATVQADQHYIYNISGGGITASGIMIADDSSIAGVPGGVEQVVKMTGTFSDTNVTQLASAVGVQAIVSTPVPPLVITSSTPLTGNFVPLSAQGFSLDDLLFPSANAPLVCDGYPFGGGLVDTYGLVFDTANGYTVGLWSDGTFMSNAAPSQYQVGVALLGNYVDYPDPTDGIGEGVNFTIQSVPEPSSFAFLGAGVLGLLLVRRKR